MHRFLSLFILLASCLPVFGQTVKQSGNVTPGHAASWTTNGIIQDAGTAANGFLASLGVIGQGETICQRTAPPTAPGYQQLCWNLSDTNGVSLIIQNYGTDTPQPFSIVLNGVTYPFPFGQANLVGTAPIVVTPSAGLFTIGLTNPLAIAYGGTGQATASAAIAALMPTPTQAGDVAYWNGSIWTNFAGNTSGTNCFGENALGTPQWTTCNSAVGITIHMQVSLATAVALPANTYNNGSSGVGATLTGNSNGALTIDSVLTTSAIRVVVKNEAAPENNGIYTVTTVGDGSNPYVLTRATDANTPGTGNPLEIGYGSYIFVVAGTANANTSWAVNSTVTTIGTSAINWAQFSSAEAVTVSNSDGSLTISPTSGNIVASLNLANSNTWTAPQTIDGTLTVNPTPASTDQAIIINQSSPTSSSIAGPTARCVQNFEPTFVYNSICITDSLNVTGVGTTFTTGLNVGIVTGGSNSQGTKAALYATLAHVAASSPSAYRDNIAIGSLALSAASEGGTDTGAGAQGTLFASAFQAQLASGGTNYFVISGSEVDIGILTGGSSEYRFGWSVVDNGQLQAASYDTAFEVGAAGSGPGFKTALLIDNIHGNAPLSTLGCVICTDGSSDTITTGIDLSTYTINGYAFKFANSFLTGTGFLQAVNVNTTGSYQQNGVNGVTCSGSPTSSFHTAFGIVTHC